MMEKIREDYHSRVAYSELSFKSCRFKHEKDEKEQRREDKRELN